MAYDPLDPNPEDLGPFQWPAASNFGKEMRKWDTPKSRGGMKPDGFIRFPMMLYKAQQPHGSGKWTTEMPIPPRYLFPTDAAWTNAVQEAENFTKQCQRKVANEQEYAQARSEGWCDSNADALAAHKDIDEIARETLYRHAEDRKLGEAAQAEARIVDEENFDHVPEVTPAAVSEATEKRRASLAKAREAKKAKAVPAA